MPCQRFCIQTTRSVGGATGKPVPPSQWEAGQKKAMERLRTYVASRCRILLQAWGGQSGLCSLPTGSVHQDSDLFSYFFVRLALLLRLESSQQWDDAELLEPTTGATAWTALALKDLSSPTARVHAVLETEGEQHSWPASLAFTPPLSI